MNIVQKFLRLDATFLNLDSAILDLGISILNLGIGVLDLGVSIVFLVISIICLDTNVSKCLFIIIALAFFIADKCYTQNYMCTGLFVHYI